FDLNWQPVHTRAGAPKVTVSMRSAGGSVLTIGATSDGCTAADHYVFDAMHPGEQLVLSAATTDANVSRLRVTIDGLSAMVPLVPTCSDAEEAENNADRRHPCADDPLTYDRTNGYSATMHT